MWTDVFSAIGEVEQNGDTYKVTYEGNTLVLSDSRQAYLNEESITLDASPVFHQKEEYGGIFMGEVREIASILGLHTRTNFFYYAEMEDRFKLELANYDLGEYGLIMFTDGDSSFLNYMIGQ